MDGFSKLVEEFGEPQHRKIVPKFEAESYRGRVPESLIEFWIKHGRGCYQRGKDWICDPAPFVSVVEAIFKHDPEIDPLDLVVFHRSAFADLTLWNSRIDGPVTVSLNTGKVSVFGRDTWIDEATKLRHSSDFIIGALIYRSKYVEAWVTDDDQDMLPIAIDHCGELQIDEVYGFFPALQIGGGNKVENLRRVKAVEHFLFLTEITEFKLIRMIFPNPGDPGGYRREIVRRIGAQ